MRVLRNCRMCESGQLYKFLDLGETALADRFIQESQLKEFEPRFPLQVVLCEACGLAQLNVVVSPTLLYCEDYPYESSTTVAGREHWHEFAETTVRMLCMEKEDLVVDIGSNVGVLLKMFQRQDIRVLGVDPAANIAKIACENGVNTLSGFFTSETAKKIVSNEGRAKVVTATNVFAHIDDLMDLIEAIDALLHERGVFIVEMPYFADLLRNLEYDTIYHEHLSYVSLKPAVRFFEKFGMEIFEVQRRDIHGGSFRIFVRRKGIFSSAPGSIVGQLLTMEEKDAIHSHKAVDEFATAVAQNRLEVRDLLQSAKHDGKRIAGVSAPAKGMTLLNYCGIGNDLLTFVTEKSKLKIGRYTPGMHIKVVGDEMLTQEQPEYALLLAWNFANEIMSNLRAYSDRGGKFIIPIPKPRIVG